MIPSAAGRRWARLATLVAGVFLLNACVAGPRISTSGTATSPGMTGSSNPNPSPSRPVLTSEHPIDLAALKGHIAFSAGPPGAEDIYTVDPDGSELRRVTTDPGADFDPSWSPDGSQIAYRHQSDGSSTSEIYLIGADGSSPTNLSHNEGNNPDWGPAWSPDGSTIAWNTHQAGPGSSFVLGLVSPNGNQFHTIDPGIWVEYPAWSPDGLRIAIMSQTPEGSDNYEIAVMNSDGTGAVRLTDVPGPDGWPAWSPDGSLLAFTTVRDDCAFSDAPDCLSSGDIGPFHTLWIMNADGTRQHQVSRRFVQIPAWSPDGGHLVFGTRRGLGILTADGSAYVEVSLELINPNFPDWLR